MTTHEYQSVDDDRIGLANINQQCMSFIQQCGNIPLYKSLPRNYTDIHKVKVRQRKRHSNFSQTFNHAFDQHNLRQRAIFANGVGSYVQEEDSDNEPFYVFPINGFKFMYCDEVDNSTDNYKQVFDTILDTFGRERGTDMIAELLRFNYKTDSILDGICSGSEVILYDIPYYYAVREASVHSYDALLDNIT
jgi:hypothetical protein